MKTIVQFDLIRLGDNDYCTDPNTLYVFGFINFNMLEELMTSADYLNEEGLSFEEVAERLQMEEEEVDRLYDHGNMVKRGGLGDFNKGWIVK